MRPTPSSAFHFVNTLLGIINSLSADHALMPLRVGELFAGVGGFRLGFESEQNSHHFQVIWSNQWEPSTKKQHASAVYSQRWGLEATESDPELFGEASDLHVNKDIATLDIEDVPDLDLLCGGFPCQDYSVAKTADKAKGIQGKKGVLWWEIRRLVEGKKPAIVLLENVDRLLKSPTSQRGRDFAVMLASLDELGYVVEWRSINAADYGMPQRRRRVFILAYAPNTPLNERLTNADPLEYLAADGILANAFPIRRPSLLSCPSKSLRLKEGDGLAEISESFAKNAKKEQPSWFKKCGMMKSGTAYTFDAEPSYKGSVTLLGDVLVSPGKVPNEFYISVEDVLKPKGWQYLKGAKKEMRKGTEGFTYSYNEGPMVFPDPLDRPSRTIITGEGGASPSRFKHVVKFRPPKSAYEGLQLGSEHHQSVRKGLGLKKYEWIRRLTPIELERLNMFPDNHTAGATDAKRAFFMGNALVVGIVDKIGAELVRSLNN